MSIQESTLTSPSDKNITNAYVPNSNHPPLTDTELKNALKDLNNSKFIVKYPHVERRYVDPVDISQKYGLFSFVPAKGATPNDKGVFGFAKLRGNYATQNEADEKAETLIRNTDSYHQIYHTYVGRPFPCTVSPDYCDNVTEIDITKDIKESVSTSIRNTKEKEKKELEEIKEKEKELLQDVEKDEENPEDRYTMLKVKKAQLVWTYFETEKKMLQMKDSIIKATQEIQVLDKESIKYSQIFFKKYQDARANSGLDNSDNQDTFMRYLVEDIKLPF